MKLNKHFGGFAIGKNTVRNINRDEELNLWCDYKIVSREPFRVKHDNDCNSCKEVADKKALNDGIFVELKAMAVSCDFEDFYKTNNTKDGYKWLSHNSCGNFGHDVTNYEGWNWWMDYPTSTKIIGEFLVSGIKFTTYYKEITNEQIKKLSQPQDSGYEDFGDWLNVND